MVTLREGEAAGQGSAIGEIANPELAHARTEKGPREDLGQLEASFLTEPAAR
jgi:hypothetical protein